jgi:hypothetical protein
MSRDPMKPVDDKTIPNTMNESTNTRVDDVKERVADIAAKTKDKAGQIAETVSEKLDEQREYAAGGLNRVASTIHENADSVPGGSKVVNFTHGLADRMESTATYLRENDFSKMGEDLVAICRKYPTQSFVAALTMGFLIGRSARR